MKKLFAMFGLIGLISFAPQPARSEVGFSIFISNAPPPPPVVFHRSPRFVLVPEEDVYVCDDYYSDYDIFRYGGFYYLYDDGYWYRSRSYGGPFLAIRIAYVPRQIFYVGDYGYRWRERPRYHGTYVSNWGYGDRRYTRDWRSYDRSRSGRRYSTIREWNDRPRDSGVRYRDGSRTTDRRSTAIRDWGDRDRRSGSYSQDRRSVESSRDRGDRREVRSRDDDDRGNGKAKGNSGRGRGKGRGHGND